MLPQNKLSTNHQVRLFINLVLVAAFSLLAGCGQTDNAAVYYVDYHQRLARTLLMPDNITHPAYSEYLMKVSEQLGPINTRFWPDHYDQNNASLSLFIKISGCSKLKQTIAKRNNQLGKFQALLLRWQHEIQVRADLQQCLTEHQHNSQAIQAIAVTSESTSSSLSHSSTSIELVESLIINKQNSLLADFWNPLFAHTWFDQFASTHIGLPFNQQNAVIASAQAIEYFEFIVKSMIAHQESYILSEHRELDSTDLLYAFQKIDGHHTLGQLIYSLYEARFFLNQTRNMIDSVNIKTYCPPGLKRTQHSYFKNVVFNHYAAEVQPHVSILSREGKRLLIAMDTLLNRFPSTPGLDTWWQSVYRDANSEWSQFRLAVKQHAQALSTLSTQCGIELFANHQG